jgi:hypothetical protein
MIIADPAHSAAASALDLRDAWVRTDFGGVFYLINLALHLELYGDFTSPARPGIELAIWDFLALVGRRLAGAQLTADPLWALLAELAGRTPDTAPGTGFTPPDVWRIPTEWLAPFDGTGAWVYSTRGRRLRVRHPAGFLVLDLPIDHDPLAQLERELAQLGIDSLAVLAVRRSSITSRRSSSLDRWLGWIVPYLDIRLRAALGLSAGDDLAALLLTHPAQVYVTGSHLDIVLSLANLPIAIRLAGLDRDPGWVPAAGRIVRFHFMTDDER